MAWYGWYGGATVAASQKVAIIERDLIGGQSRLLVIHNRSGIEDLSAAISDVRANWTKFRPFESTCTIDAL